ncbi:hypothetical protein EKK58_04700 [Candidatus Dependentiae bacterium]|nr:MAG: hypothetical protein EKK58_04700 [Candidatus Dependentiae bacterium]
MTILFCFLNAFIFLRVSSYDFYLVNEQAIEKEAGEIGRTLLFHSRLEKMLQCTSTVALLYCFWKMVPSFVTEDNQPKLENSLYSYGHGQANVQGSLNNYVASIPSKVVNAMIAIPYDLIVVIKNGDLFKSLGSMIANYLLVSIVNFAIESSLNKVCHRHTIGWYVQTHAPYQQTISLLIQQVGTYQERILKKDSKAHFEYEVMVGMTNLLLQHLERVIAYMTYRISTIQKKHQPDAIAVKNLFLNYVLDWRLQITEVFLDSNHNEKLKLLLNQCYNEVDRMYKMFALYEKHL